MFTQDELNIITAVINRVDIKGSEATTIALLQQKIAVMMKPVEEPKEDKKK